MNPPTPNKAVPDWMVEAAKQLLMKTVPDLRGMSCYANATDALQARAEEVAREIARHAPSVPAVDGAQQALSRAADTIEKMDQIHDDIMINGPRCTCGDCDEWCERCTKSSKLSSLAASELSDLTPYLAPHPTGKQAEGVTDTEMLEWLIANAARVISAAKEMGGLEGGYFVFWGDTEDDGEWQNRRYSTPREAIAAALRSSNQTGEGRG